MGRFESFSCTLLLAGAGVLVAGCAASGGTTKEVVEDQGPWIRASPLLRQQIDDEAARLPWTHGFERLESIRWFASVGEPAYSKLLELTMSEREDVAAAALAALGATQDGRLVPTLRELPWREDLEGTDLELERARTLLRLGDWSEIPALLRGLEDGRVFTRSLCIDALVDATHEDLGYDPRAEEDERKLALERWHEWWFARSREGLIKGS